MRYSSHLRVKVYGVVWGFTLSMETCTRSDKLYTLQMTLASAYIISSTCYEVVTSESESEFKSVSSNISTSS